MRTMSTKNKANLNGYSWVPVAGPLVGGALAALLYLVVHNLT